MTLGWLLELFTVASHCMTASWLAAATQTRVRPWDITPDAIPVAVVPVYQAWDWPTVSQFTRLETGPQYAELHTRGLGYLKAANHSVFVSRKIPVLGKHTKKIKCGCWSKQNLLALVSDDRTLSVSNSDGDTVKQFAIQGDPGDVQFSEMKADERSSFGENTVSSHCPSTSSISSSFLVIPQRLAEWCDRSFCLSFFDLFHLWAG